MRLSRTQGEADAVLDRKKSAHFGYSYIVVAQNVGKRRPIQIKSEITTVI